MQLSLPIQTSRAMLIWLTENVRINTDVFSPWHSPSKLDFVFLCHDSA